MSLENEDSEVEPTEPVNTGGGDDSEPPTKQDYTPAMLCHLLSLLQFIGIPLGNILGPLVVWLTKKDDDAFVNATGKEVLNFQISMTIYAAVCIPLVWILIGMILLPVILIINVVCTIIAALKSNEGILYRYPITIRFLK